MSSKRDMDRPWGEATAPAPAASTTGEEEATNKTAQQADSDGKDDNNINDLSYIMEQQEEERLVLEQVRQMEQREAEEAAAASAQADESEEDRQIRLAIEASLRDVAASNPEGGVAATTETVSTRGGTTPPAAAAAAAAAVTDAAGLTPEEMEQIHRALQESSDDQQQQASTDDDAASLQLALRLHREEEERVNRQRLQTGGTGGGSASVRVVHHDDFQRMKPSPVGGTIEQEQQEVDHTQYINYYDDDQEDDYDCCDEGYRINQPSHQAAASWSRIGGGAANVIMSRDGREVRTKHDTELKHRSNAHRLGLSSVDVAGGVSDRAYNSFRNKIKRGTVKGVSRTGTGRAENMTHDRTRGGALDGRVRLQVQRAINTGIINSMNGAVKEGKEAVVYHADGPTDGEHDVAVKVFKRIQEFRQRGTYVDGDPRYSQKFNTLSKREQVELWTEKEFRNLVRANSAGVPSPKPILQKQNILFMRFLGEDGWPAPQLREVELKRGSKRWTHLYYQTMVAIRRLYHCAWLVHGDLSEYNLLLCPAYQVNDRGAASRSKIESTDSTLQVVLIDFGQAVHVGHPSADELLRRDLSRVKFFFENQGIRVLSDGDALEFVVAPFQVATDSEGDESNVDSDGPDLTNEEADFVVVEKGDVETLPGAGDLPADSAPNGCDSGPGNVKGDGPSKLAFDEKGTLIASDVEQHVAKKQGARWRRMISVWDEEKDYEQLQNLLDAF